MKRNYDKKLMEDMIIKYNIDTFFSNNKIPKFIMEYEKGEYISSSLSDEHYVQFMVKGQVSIYCIREDGSAYSLAMGTDAYVFGETELFQVMNSNVYAEALTDVVCVAVSIEESRELLLQDTVFLKKIAENLAYKLAITARMDVISTTLENRVLNYMKYYCEEGCFSGLEKTAFCLHCSPRQLQRIVNGLEERGEVKKLGKGKYQLCSQHETLSMLQF